MILTGKTTTKATATRYKDMLEIAVNDFTNRLTGFNHFL